ncbi:uncharacterized protein G2W53_009755 [Senna tora]|uniref:Uncharacterized protein n=1 Tax=Senna tora TaxID=362788 RepID=A0A835C8H3_9FABA|nr:uncharacterized protein G2W53_009755 [Senna tora]
MTRQKTCCASESNTSVLVVFANGSGFDVPIGVVLAWEERGSCLNIFRTTNRGRISETFTNYETKTCCASASNTSVRVVFANGSGFDAPIGVVLAWEERGSCLNIFRTTNRGRISETFTNYEAKDLLRKSVDLVLTYSGRQITVGSQKPSRITRQKTCCASESNTSVRVVFANRSGFDALIGVVLAWEERGSCLNIFRTTKSRLELRNLHELRGKRLVVQVRVDIREPEWVLMLRLESFLAWEERGSCLNIFRMTNRGRISETFTNYEAKNLLRKRVKHVGSRTGVVFDSPIGVVLAWEERGSCLNIFRTTNRGRISETFTNYEAKDLLRKLVKHVGSANGIEYDWRSTQGWKTNTLKDPLQGIGDPMTRARSKRLKVALNCFRRDLKELEPNYIKESTINMSSKCPRKVVTMLKPNKMMSKAYGVHMEELT